MMADNRRFLGDTWKRSTHLSGISIIFWCLIHSQTDFWRIWDTFRYFSLRHHSEQWKAHAQLLRKENFLVALMRPLAENWEENSTEKEEKRTRTSFELMMQFHLNCHSFSSLSNPHMCGWWLENKFQENPWLCNLSCLSSNRSELEDGTFRISVRISLSTRLTDAWSRSISSESMIQWQFTFITSGYHISRLRATTCILNFPL